MIYMLAKITSQTNFLVQALDWTKYAQEKRACSERKITLCICRESSSMVVNCSTHNRMPSNASAHRKQAGGTAFSAKGGALHEPEVP
mmetsp:Transcript_13759/g.26251  ORF Transcript_13759/g.26251 Transcript_13759/m.26251 type:complete len:87 (+) Transcript_13759:558-818(+)